MPEDLIGEGHCINCPGWVVRSFSDMIEFLEIAKSVKYMFQAMVTILIDKHVHPRSSTQHYRKKYKPKKGRKTNKQTGKQTPKKTNI